MTYKDFKSILPAVSKKTLAQNEIPLEKDAETIIENSYDDLYILEFMDCDEKQGGIAVGETIY